MRIVLDTNVLIDGFQDDYSAEAKLIDAVRSGELFAIATKKVVGEYRLILARLIADKDYRSRIEDFLSMLEHTEPEYVDVTLDDEEDMKFLEAAVGGDAEVVVTSDRHLLDAGEADGVQIMTPEEAIARFEEESGTSKEWQGLIQGWGLDAHEH
ncbi:MAG TPA: putative toxin-antitoxin system toxin component, PIN family [Candidatus Andersenbacteria bacterium]|nr:putative toxin-antitoxin system toxin component, PIN family [Candidatus Andersenbacteria bacterium]